jgi:hypothetical protein
MSAAEFGSTDAVEMSVFHALLLGNGRRPPRLGVPFPFAVNVTVLPPALAVTRVVKKVRLTVRPICAFPLASVVVVALLGVPSALVQLTLTPGTGRPAASRAMTTSGAATRVP